MRLNATNLSTSSSNADVASVAQSLVKIANEELAATGVDPAALHTALWLVPSAETELTETEQGHQAAWRGAVTEAAVKLVGGARQRANFFSASSQHDSESILTIAVLIGYWRDLIADRESFSAEHRPTLEGLIAALEEQAALIVALAHEQGLAQLTQFVYEIDALAGKYTGAATAYDLVAHAVRAQVRAQLQ